ncbi:MAG TPA: hypothetical protein DCQ14_07055 [Firmicutes bacterium]|nr:hypothetical protein [Bacillota bacterium]
MERQTGKAQEQRNLGGRDQYNLGVARRMAVETLAAADPSKVCLLSGVDFNREQNSYILPYLNRRYLVNSSSGAVKNMADGSGVSPYLEVIFLHYLLTADGTPLHSEWITFKELPGGGIYGEPYRKRTIVPLLRYFGEKPEKFREVGLSLGGADYNYGDLSLLFHPFPRIAMVFVLWKGDDEFAPSANILYDACAAHYLPTEDYALLPSLIIWEIAAKL